jgi:signal transduction histidine kinase
MPIHDADNRFIGVISTDLSLLRLSKLISAEKPYRHSYFIMLDEKGDYYIHPDSTRLFTHSIFDVDDPNREADIIALGHEMTSGATGNMSVVIDGKPCIVCYQPIPGTGWSLAIVCPDSDVLENYHRLSYIIVPLLLIGVLIIMILCHRAVAHAIRPLNQLLEKTQSIASGDMEVHIPRSQRDDVVGRLQNSFARMLQSLNFHMGSVRYTTQQAKQRNEELARATALVQEADRQKTAFIQNVSHQIRTPLNILMGFAQILRDATPNSQVALSGDEVKIIVSTMNYNAKLLNRMVTMLFDSSETGLSEELQEVTKHSQVPCNDVAREAISYTKLHYPDLNVLLQSEVDDDFCINTNRLYLMRSLREILYNSAKYSDRQHVAIHITRQPATDSRQTTVCFIIEDTGNGISEEYQDLMFKFFTKVDDLSEGLGLGLPLAKRHAQTLGGDLTLDHDYHNGCRFILELPIT